MADGMRYVFKVTDVPLIQSPDGTMRDSVMITEDTCGSDQYTAGLFWVRPGTDGHSDVHPAQDEVYYIISGSGTLVTGGRIVNQSEPMEGPVVDNVVGPSFTGESRGGQVRVVSEGDVVVIPAGLFHGWPVVPDHVTYLSVRPDPAKVLPAGYSNPAIQ